MKSKKRDWTIFRAIWWLLFAYMFLMIGAGMNITVVADNGGRMPVWNTGVTYNTETHFTITAENFEEVKHIHLADIFHTPSIIHTHSIIFSLGDLFVCLSLIFFIGAILFIFSNGIIDILSKIKFKKRKNG